MKRFIFKGLLFILPFSVIIVEGFLPVSTYTHRPWEALLFRSSAAMPFYPNQTLGTISVGGLCHNTQFAIEKKEDWITDKLGYRNNTFIEKPDVVLIGDSFITGTSITQDSTIANLLKGELNKKVYSIAPAGFNDFIDLLDQDVIKKPKTVIFSFVERFVPAPIIDSTDRVIPKRETSFSIFRDKVKRFYTKKYLKARIKGSIGTGVKGIDDSRMFFLNGKNQEYHNDKIEEVANTIQSYKEYCDSMGVDFVFLPLPNKETVYFDKVPFETQPDYLLKLDLLVKEKNVNTINSLELFNAYSESNSNTIYHLDDSHWNAKGVELVVKEIAKTLNGKTQQGL